MYPKYAIAMHALQQTAIQRGIPYRSMIEAIEEAIQDAYTTAAKEGNQAVLDAWNAIPRKGEVPSPLELVAYITELCKNEL